MSMTDFNAGVIAEFRANSGKVGSFGDAPLLLLHAVGAKSGKTHVQPLVYLPDDGRYVVFASKAGAPTNPAWYHNLKANPEVSIEVGDETVAVIAREVTGEERDRLFNAQAQAMPQFAEYAEKTTRLIPAIALVRRD